MQANTYDAEMGRTGGGTFNTFLRSGTNELHGSAFGYLRQHGLAGQQLLLQSRRASRSRISRSRTTAARSAARSSFPRSTTARNRTFFFVTGEAYRQYDASGTRLSVPTPLETQGRFFEEPLAHGQRRAAGDLRSVDAPPPTARARPSPGNVIPATRLSNVGLQHGVVLSRPQRRHAHTTAHPNFDSTVRAFNRADQMTFKVDHEFTRWWKASASYLHYGSQEPSNRWFPNQIASPEPGRDLPQGGRDAGELDLHAFADHWSSRSRYGFNRFPNFTPPISLGFDLTTLGLPASLAAVTQYTAFPAITMSDFASYGGGTTSQNVFHSKSFNTTLVEVHGQAQPQGRLRLPAAASRRRARHRTEQLQLQRRLHARRRRRRPRTGTGASLATMLLGYPTGGSMTVGTNFYNYVKLLRRRSCRTICASPPS